MLKKLMLLSVVMLTVSGSLQAKNTADLTHLREGAANVRKKLIEDAALARTSGVDTAAEERRAAFNSLAMYDLMLQNALDDGEVIADLDEERHSDLKKSKDKFFSAYLDYRDVR